MNESKYDKIIAAMLAGSTPVAAQIDEPNPIVKNVGASSILNLLQAIRNVESTTHDSNAIGDKGKAYGHIQIWNIAVQDVNQIYGTNYSHEDMFNPHKSVDVFVKYLTHYGDVYTRKTGKQPTYEVLARIWNGGPNGWRKELTIPYWNKVKAELNK